MSLTVGSAPFAAAESVPVSDPEADRVLVFDEVHRRVRVVLGDRVVADTTGARLLHETGRMVEYYVPRDDVDFDCLEPSETSEDDDLKGPAEIWTVEASGERVPDGARAWPEPPDGVSMLGDYVTFEFGAFDWYEEDELIDVHPRDPYHRIDVLRSSRRVRVAIGDTVIAETARPRLMFESSLPPRYYLPPEDVRCDLLESSTRRTRCPYKGTASYWHVEVGGTTHEDVFWSYEEPRKDAREVESYLSFIQSDDRLRVDVD